MTIKKPLVKSRGNITHLPFEVDGEKYLIDNQIFRLPEGWEKNPYIVAHVKRGYFKIFEDKYYAKGKLLIDIPEVVDGKIVGEVKFNESLFEIPIEEQDKSKPELEPEEKLENIIEPIKKSYTEIELEEKYKELGFKEFRNWVKEEFKVTGRSKTGLIQDILDVQSGKKEEEL